MLSIYLLLPSTNISFKTKNNNRRVVAIYRLVNISLHYFWTLINFIIILIIVLRSHTMPAPTWTTHLLHARMARLVWQKKFTFTKKGRRCNSIEQSITQSACFTEYRMPFAGNWSKSFRKMHFPSQPYHCYPCRAHGIHGEQGEPIVKPDITTLYKFTSFSIS